MEKFYKIKAASPLDELMINRLTADPRRLPGSQGETIRAQTVANLFRRTVRDVSDIRNIFKVMPWLHLPREILISSITSPGDMIQVKLNIYNKLKTLPPTLGGKLDQVLKDFYLDEQQLESDIYDWVDVAYILKGSYPILIIPEASLDKLLGVSSAPSMESLNAYDGAFEGNWFTPMGLLGVPKVKDDKTSYESFESAYPGAKPDLLDLHTIKGISPKEKKVIKLPITVTDNPAILRKPLVDKLRQAAAVRRTYGASALDKLRRSELSTEGKRGNKSAKDITDADIYNHFFKKRKCSDKGRMAFITPTSIDENKDLGHPLPYHLPHESVIPVYIPGDVTNHTRYIIILDSSGYPVSFTRQMEFYDDIRGYMSNNGSESQAAGDILQLAKETMSGSVQDFSNDEIDRLTQMNTAILQQDIVNRLRSGMSGGEFQVSFPESVNRMLLSFAMSGRRVTFLVVPAEYMIYMAYDYNEFGIGKSALEDGKGLAAQAASVHVANVLGGIQNAIPGKDINIELDPDDRTPVETVTFMAGEALNLAYRQMPQTVSTVAGMTEQLQLSAFNINVSGNSRYPGVRSTITPRESSMVVIDPELKQSLKDELNNLFGLTSEMVDNVNQPGFAVTAVNQSMLLLKRVMVGQAKTNPFLTDYVRIFTYNSGILLNRLKNVLDANKKDIPKGYTDLYALIEDYLDNVYCELPKPQTENVEKEAELLGKMNESLDVYLDASFKEEYLGGINDPMLEEAYPVLRQGVKGLLMRQWMRKHGIFRDLDIFNSGEDGERLANIEEEISAHTDTLRASVGNLTKQIAEYVIRRKKRMSTVKKLVDKAAEGEDEVLSGTDLDPNSPQPSDQELDDLDTETPLDDDVAETDIKENEVEVDTTEDDEEEQM